MYPMTVLASFGALSSIALAAPVDDTATLASITDTAAATSAPKVSIEENAPVPDDSLEKSTAALGAANVRNHCNFPVYLYVCGQNPATCTAERTLAAHTGTFSEKYSTVNNGRSIKIGRTPGKVAKPLLQWEYTHTSDGRVAYDVSSVNGNPFGPFGYDVTSSNGKCPQPNCKPPGTHAVCPFVFHDPTNGKVLYCGAGSSIGITLCES
ncbi:uncharacterized protein KY384_006208 [Bacidia gigantensis]|uniref:uncharacterized protein n=1 Tax=Bacidia gigantensis TaxID=2732470 RepID=UPI001D04C459|nr:uncharacterized protein KY384_006208 [Bacidia gigantensis]KAG8529571.1 hypothetical protein KY384_006208 [Bacidia gigantensis]